MAADRTPEPSSEPSVRFEMSISESDVAAIAEYLAGM